MVDGDPRGSRCLFDGCLRRFLAQEISSFKTGQSWANWEEVATLRGEPFDGGCQGLAREVALD